MNKKIYNGKEVIDKNTGLKFKESNDIVDIGTYKTDVFCRKCNDIGNIEYIMENYQNVKLLTFEIGLEIPGSNNEGDLHKKYKYEKVNLNVIKDINLLMNNFEMNLSDSCLICNEEYVNE